MFVCVFWEAGADDGDMASGEPSFRELEQMDQNHLGRLDSAVVFLVAPKNSLNRRRRKKKVYKKKGTFILFILFERTHLFTEKINGCCMIFGCNL